MKLKTIIAALTALLMVSGCNNNSKSTDNMKDMSKLTFTEQQASAITAIACNEARGDQSSLLNAINEGFDAKLSANQRGTFATLRLHGFSALAQLVGNIAKGYRSTH